jgi:hypothetical protein
VAILHGKGGNDGKLAAAVDEAAAAALKPLPLTAAERSGDSPTASEKPRELDAPHGKEAAAKGEVPLVAENPNEKSRGACPSSHGIVPSATPIPVSLYSLSHFGLLFMRLQQTGQQQQEPFAEKVAATTEKYFRQYLDHLAPRVTTFDQVGGSLPGTGFIVSKNRQIVTKIVAIKFQNSCYKMT